MHGLRWGLAAGLLCVVAAPAAAAELHRIDIPAGSLQQAVLALGRQAGISIALTDTGLAAVQVRRVRGRMSVDQALRRLLKGENVFSGHRSHLFQQLVSGGYKHGTISALYIFLTALAVLLSYEWSHGDRVAPLLIFLGLPLIWILLSIHAAGLQRAE